MNTNNQLGREKEIFEQALDLPSAEARLGYAQGACGDDAELLARVQALLRAHAATGGFLPENPGAASGPTVYHVSAESVEKPGTIIGRYKLLEKIGEGGFGSVYMAEQEVPVRRRVALKVIKLGMDTKEVVARFEAERQALAMMDHPNIAKVLDAGATETGRPYFVMELVKGVPITTYCDQRRLSTTARLELFILVCQAVQHAHQKGIIHRDLKPSNILVTEQDDRAVPKVIDFGVARATQARLTEKTMFTQFHQMVGTPAYMSPEQTGLANLDIDTRSDIYSLGVLLYELLTGCTPFDSKKLLEAGYDGIMKMIREVEPPKPSTRLSSLSMQELTELGGRRHEEPRRIGRLVQGDLDWIVMKALEKDRSRRYETATNLAQDLQRHLGNEPVVARPPSAAYRLQKLARRHRVAFATAAAISVALLLGTALASWQAIRATKAEQVARKEAQKSERAAKALAGVFSEIGPHVLRGEDTKLLRSMLDEAAQRLPKELESEPAVLAFVIGAFAGVYSDLLDPVKAKEMAGKRLELLRKLDPVPLEDEVDALATTALYSIETKDIAEGERLLNEARSKVAGLTNKSDAMQEQLLDVQVNLLSVKGDYPRAREIRREILERKRTRLGPQHLEVAQALMDLSYMEFSFYRGSADREAMILDAYNIRRIHRPDGDPLVAETALRLAEIYSLRGRFQEAETLLRRQLNGMMQPLPQDLWRWWEGTNGALANLLARRGKVDEALELCREQLAFARANFAPNHNQIGLSLSRLGEMLLRKGELAEAESLAREEMDLWGRRYGFDSINYHVSAIRLARVFSKKLDFSAADTLLRRIIDRAIKEYGSDDIRVAPYLTELARLELAQGDADGAIALRRRVLAIPSWKDAQKDLQQDMSSAHLGLANVLIKGAQYQEAEKILLAAWNKEAASDSFRYQLRRDLLESLVQLYAEWGKQDTARADHATSWQKELKEFDAAQARREAAATKQ